VGRPKDQERLSDQEPQVLHGPRDEEWTGSIPGPGRRVRENEQNAHSRRKTVVTMEVKQSDWAKFWHVSTSFGDIELLHARYVTQTFSKHAHDRFAIGVIERGALGFQYRREKWVAPAGSVNLANPGEPHTGYAEDSAWIYRMLYLDTRLLQQATAEITGRTGDIPFFRHGVLHDTHLARAVRHLHISLREANLPQLEQESLVLRVLKHLIVRYAVDRPIPHQPSSDPDAVRRVREYIDSHYAENPSTQDLARIANFSPYHFIHLFHDVMGLPPHAYLTQVRVVRAKDLLSQGWPISQVALETGFVDQSHLTRQFKRMMGVTPGQYRNSIQDQGALR
jgi:AraC-like DNA-binding protein